MRNMVADDKAVGPSGPQALARATALLGAALAGLGVIFWLAANWNWLGRFGQFALLECAMALAALGASWRLAWRAPLALLLFLLTGGLLAHVGQTYQTGADPWQLFALWSVLGLPLAWSVRHDALWVPWIVVFMTALSLWTQSHTGPLWRHNEVGLAPHLIGWALALLAAAGLSPAGRRWSGAGIWSWRLSLALSAILITVAALMGLSSRQGDSVYVTGLLVLAGATGLLSQPRHVDLYGMSVLALAANVLLVAGLARLLVENSHALASWLLLGVSAAALLGATVKWVLWHASLSKGPA